MSDIPLKQCIRREKCVNPLGCWLPATAEYFRVEKKVKCGFRGDCRKCELEAKRVYRIDHPEAVRAADRKLRERNIDKRREGYRRYAREHRDERIAYAHEYDELNRDAKLERGRQWRQGHPEQVRDGCRRRRANKSRLPNDFTPQDAVRSINYFNGVCAYCGCSARLFDRSSVLHLDHYIPLTTQNCPGTITENIVPACQTCNQSKTNKDPEQWLIQRFGKRKANAILKRIHAYFDWVRQQDS